MPSNSKEYANKYYLLNIEKRKQYYIDNKDKIREQQNKYKEKNKEELKKNIQDKKKNFKNRVINIDDEDYKVFLEYLNIISHKIENNKYYVKSHIYKDDLVNQYININLEIFRKHFDYENWRNLLRTKKLANQMLRRMCRVLNIPNKTFQKNMKVGDKKTSETFIVVSL